MTTKQLLTRPRNAGLYEVGGVNQDVKAAWEPIIDPETHEALLRRLKVTGRTQPGRKPSHVGTGIIFCGVCGQTMRTGTGSGKPTYKCKAKTIQSAATYADGSRHVTIQAHFVEAAVKNEIVNAFFLGADVLSQTTTEGKDVTAIHRKIQRAEEKREEPIASASEEDSAFTMKDIAPAVRKLNATLEALEALEADLNALTTEKAHAAMLDLIRRSMAVRDEDTHWVDMDVAEEVYAALCDRYDSLTLSTKKALPKDLLDVTILPSGRGAKKIKIHHKVVTSLNIEEAARAA